MSAKSCAYAACTCRVEIERKYCSESCKRASSAPVPDATGCSCGHQVCLGQAGRKGSRALGAGKFESPEAAALPSEP